MDTFLMTGCHLNVVSKIVSALHHLGMIILVLHHIGIVLLLVCLHVHAPCVAFSLHCLHAPCIALSLYCLHAPCIALSLHCLHAPFSALSLQRFVAGVFVNACPQSGHWPPQARPTSYPGRSFCKPEPS